MEILAHYIAGEWISGTSEEYKDDVNPSDFGQVLAKIPLGDDSTVQRAVEAANNAFKGWKHTPGPGRAEFMHRVANLLAQHRQDVARVVALEVGKPIGEALAEVDRGVVILRYYAEEAVHPMGSVIPAQVPGSLQLTVRDPVGPLGVITPWNFPVAIPLWKISPAIAFGNTVVWKPAEMSSMVAVHLMKIFAEAGLPQGVVNLVLGSGSKIGKALVASDGIRAITFTGSEGVGMGIAQQAAQRNIKYQLEMGGKNAAIVLPDADLRLAARLIASGAMRYAGQKCTATSRAVVVADVIDSFIEHLIDEVKALPVAPAIDANSAVGPLISEDALSKVSYYADEGAKSGEVVLGGKRAQGPLLDRGYFFEPTVIRDVFPDAKVAQEEIFGPVLVVHEAKDLDDAINIANNSRYGLSVSMFTRDINAILSYIPNIEAGMVRVNADTTGVDPHAPFGGMKSSSSHSREQGPAAVEFFTDTKTVQINPVTG